MGEDRTPPRIPASWDELSPAWMTSALAGSYPGVEVSRVDVLLRDDGTNRRARLGLSYRRGEYSSTVFVKAADPAHAKTNARTGGVFNEARLFLSDVPLPLDHRGSTWPWSTRRTSTSSSSWRTSASVAGNPATPPAR